MIADAVDETGLAAAISAFSRYLDGIRLVSDASGAPLSATREERGAVVVVGETIAAVASRRKVEMFIILTVTPIIRRRVARAKRAKNWFRY